ncbi:alpha/beta fold hydrolase [Dactylosporangium roseum]|uniref:alpha/beta fold hydrolase n=1 Tax=Dactylosporangium roseum TaxID=47989 RepID=UPI0021B1A0F4|nr:alpha/beta hydrolase [Dactylosporangium roseum]
MTSSDGTVIAYDRVGGGPALILVDAAGRFRGLSSFSRLIELLAADFTVYHYDRRGRGESTDTPPYDVAREVEDLAALIDAAGGSAMLYGFSSGALLALHAAARGLPIPRLAVLEPPIDAGQDRAEQDAFIATLSGMVAEGRRIAALQHFMSGVGVPEEIVAGMRGTGAPHTIAAIAHTLVYDAEISRATSPSLLATVGVPTLVIDSEDSDDDLQGRAATVARALPRGTARSLPGEWHGLPDDVLAGALVEFFKG